MANILLEHILRAKTESTATATTAQEELERLGVDMTRAEKDGSSSFFNISVPISTLKEHGYKRIKTNSDDYTQSFYTNGTWVIHQIACTGGYLAIYKLGKEAKQAVDAGKEVDVFNKSLEESDSADVPAKFVVEYDFQNLSKLGEPLITEHVKDVLYAKTVAEAEALFAEMIDKSKQYDSAYVSISRPMFLGNSLLSTEPYRVYTDGKLIKNIKLTESNNDELIWNERSSRRRVAQLKLRGCEVEIEEHSAIDGLHYYLYVEDTDIDDILCNGREFATAEAALSYAYEITAAPEPEKSQYSDETKPNSLDVVTETMSDEEYDSATVEFADQLEAKIKKAFPGCEYEEELATQGKWGIDFIYVSLFGHTYEVQFDAAAQEDDIREMGVAKAAEIYAQDAIQNIEKQIIAVANELDQEVDFNKGNAANFLDEVEAKIRKAATEFLVKNEGIEANEASDFCTVSADIVGEHIEIAVGAELSYEPLSDLCDALNKVIEEYDKNAYFEPECPGRIVAYLMQYPYLG